MFSFGHGLSFTRREAGTLETITLTFDDGTLDDYAEFYFSQHPRAKNKPIAHPYHESINTWMIMKRPQMNGLKQKWKDFIAWFIDNQGYANLRIGECELSFMTYYSSNRRHDVDNSAPKFIIDGLCESGFIVDDDSKHIRRITLECGVDPKRPRTEITVKIYGYEPEEEKENDYGKDEED